MSRCILVLTLILAMSSVVVAASVDPALTEAMRNAKGLIPIIVELKPGVKQIDVAQLGGKMGYKYQIINGFSAQMPVSAIKLLETNPQISVITYDQVITVNSTTAMSTARVKDLWEEGYTGKGVTIAIPDTGIYPHDDFQSRIIAFKDFVGNKSFPYDDHGHGTHCSGIAAGKGLIHKGAAYEANLVGVKVLNKNGSGSLSTLIAGIDWIVQNRAVYQIRIMSLSVGSKVTQSSKTDPLCAAVRAASDAGIVVVVAAGNEGPEASTICTPANEPKVITVGASDERGTTMIDNDLVASFSARGPAPIDGWMKPDVVAPGVFITATDDAYTGYTSMSGTSTAAPLTAGVCALMLEAHPKYIPAEVKMVLLRSTTFLNGVDRFAQGNGIINAYKAVH